MYLPITSDQTFVFCTFGAQVLAVLCLDFGRLFPLCRTAPSYKPRCDRLKTRPAKVASTKVGREKGEDLAEVLPEAPGPDPLLPRYVVREENRIKDANIVN